MRLEGAIPPFRMVFLRILCAFLGARGYVSSQSGEPFRRLAGIQSLGEFSMGYDASSTNVLRTICAQQHTNWFSRPHFALVHYSCAALALLALALIVNSAEAVNPSLSGSLTVPFLF